MVDFRVSGVVRIGFGAVGALFLTLQPAQAAETLFEGSGTVTGLTGLRGAQPSGSVAVGNALTFRIVFNPDDAPRIFDDGVETQVFAPTVDSIAAQVGGFTLAPNLTGLPSSPAIVLGRGFRFFQGDTSSSSVLNQSFFIPGLGTGNLPFNAGAAGFANISFTSTFLDGSPGVVPTLVDLRDPSQAVINRFRITVSNGQSPIGFVDGDFTGSFAAITAVPEPSTWALLILGFAAIGSAMRKRRVASLSYAA